MTDDRSLERAARLWIDEGPTRAPDRPVEAALRAIDTTPQERDLRIPLGPFAPFAPRRSLPMSSITRIAAAIVAIVVVGSGLYVLAPRGGVGGPAATPTPSTATVPSPTTTVTPSAAVTPAAPTVFDTRTIARDFALPMKVTLPVGWKSLHDIVGALGIVHTGNPEGPDSTWWGPELLLVENAQIHDPSDVVSSVPATADRSRFVPWPADFFAYITALPGVAVVSGPEPITIGGVTGTQITVMTPPMHPLVWLDGDFSWLGGGSTGVDPAMERRFVVVKTGGHTLLVHFPNDPATFEARDAEVRAILDSIAFE